MKYNFCTYFDSNYVSRGLVLYYSLRQHCKASHLWILCLDDECFQLLTKMNLSDVSLISLSEFELDDSELLEAKNNRNKVEYYFTCTPSLPLYIFDNYPEVELITYIDCDLYIFSDPSTLFTEMNEYSIAIIEHRFHKKKLEKYGIYNVGWLSFRRDDEGISCLKYWRNQCLEWCYDRLEGNRYADQKYLDSWLQRYKKVNVIKHKGANVAPWNIDNYSVSKNNHLVFVDDTPLIFYHYQGFKALFGRVYDTGLGTYKARMTGPVRDLIYAPYLNALMAARQKIDTYGADDKSVAKTIRYDNEQRPLWTLLRKYYKYLRIAINVLLPGKFIVYRKQ